MFHSTLGLKIDTSFGGVFELNNVEHRHLGIAWLRFAAVSNRRNRVVSLDKSILYLQFLCKTSDSTFVLVVHDYVWDRFCCQCAEVNNFWLGRLRKWRITNSLEGKCDRCTFKKIHITILFFIRSSRGLLHYREKTFIYNLLAYVIDKFLLRNWEKLSYCRVTIFQLWHFVFFKQSSLYCWLSIKQIYMNTCTILF